MNGRFGIPRGSAAPSPIQRSGRTAHHTLHLVHKIKRHWRSTIRDNFVERLKKTEDN